MKNNLVIVFDFDDTLWRNHINYKRSIREFGKLMEKEIGGNSNDISDLFVKVDGNWGKRRGLAGNRWIESMFATMGIVCGSKGKVPSEELMSKVEKVADIPWETPELFPDTVETLEKLIELGIPMYGVSAGDEKQLIKINKLEEKGFHLGVYLKEYWIVPRKDKKIHLEKLQQIQMQERGKDMKFAFIGDSIRNDIIPSIEAGYDLSIWIDRGFHWPPHEHTDEMNWPVVDSLSEAVNMALNKLGKG